MKEKLKAIFKFILFILFAKSMYFWTSEDPVIGFFNIISFNSNNGAVLLLLMLLTEWFLNVIAKSAIMYIIAKKFGVIQFLNRFNFFIGLFFVCVIECIVLYHHSSVFCGKTEIQKYGDIITLSMLGYGFLHTFVIYNIAKAYDKKHPAFFSKIKEFKNIITNKMPFLKQDSFWIIVYGYLLLSIYKKNAIGLNYWVFFYSGVLFLIITIILAICNIVKNNIQKHKL